MKFHLTACICAVVIDTQCIRSLILSFQSEPDVKKKTKGIGMTFNLYVMLRNFVCRVDDAEILVNLFDAKDMTYIW